MSEEKKKTGLILAGELFGDNWLRSLRSEVDDGELIERRLEALLKMVENEDSRRAVTDEYEKFFVTSKNRGRKEKF
ncbi:MAG: hypothetical protein ACK4TI_00080 [Nitrososphaerales archaeon]